MLETELRASPGSNVALTDHLPIYVVTVEGIIALGLRAGGQRDAEKMALDAVRRGMLEDHTSEGHDAPEVIVRPATNAETRELVRRLEAAPLGRHRAIFAL